MFQELPNKSPSVPESIMTICLDELTDIKMKIERDLPMDWTDGTQARLLMEMVGGKISD